MANDLVVKYGFFSYDDGIKICSDHKYTVSIQGSRIRLQTRKSTLNLALTDIKTINGSARPATIKLCYDTIVTAMSPSDGNAPVNTVAPAITGVLIVGQTLTRVAGTWTADLPITTTWVWKSNGTTVQTGGATYVPQPSDVGNTIVITETATDGDGSASASSVGSVIITTLLDITGNAKGAYSSYLLRGAYYGSPLVRVRRSGDNAETDFGATTLGVLDTASIVAFCVAGGGTQHGTLVNVYDQSGQGNHLTQTTPNDQPSIVTSGVLLTTNSRVAFRGLSSDFLTVPISTNLFKFLHDGTDSLVYAVTKIINGNIPIVRTMTTSATSSIGYWFGETSSNRLNSLIANGGGVALSVFNISATSTTTTNAQVLIIDKIEANNATASNRSAITMNNGAEIKNNTNTATPSSSASSNDLRVVTGATQEFQELVIFDTQPSITTIKTNVNSRFNIY